MTEQPTGPDLEAAHIEYITGSLEGKEDMTDAPEKIWVSSSICHDGLCDAPDIYTKEEDSWEGNICYTRTDIADARIKKLESAFRSILQIPNSDAAQGIMKAFAEDALGEELEFRYDEGGRVYNVTRMERGAKQGRTL